MGGRKGAKREALGDQCVEPEADESIVRVVALRGSNQVEVEDEHGEKSLCRMPAKFTKSIWIKRGSYVLIKVQKVAVGNGKITANLSRVLYFEHVKQLQKTSFWPAGFQTQESPSEAAVDLKKMTHADADNDDEQDEVEQNLNRQGGGLLYSSDSESDED